MCKAYIVPDIIWGIITIKEKVHINDKWRSGVNNVPASKAQQKAVNKYMKENYDEIKVRVEKGQKDIIKTHAESKGESVNGFINRAIDEAMEREK